MANTPKLNNKLINCVLEHIEREVEKGSGAYDQNRWAEIATGSRQQPVKCGTTGCFAGWACLLSTPLTKWRETFAPDGDIEEVNETYDWSSVAAKKLGLTRDESVYLFHSAEGGPSRQLNTIKDRLASICKARRLKVDLSTVLAGE
jgi:hypothetical protein